MLARIALFEIRYHLKNPVLYITAVLFFILTFSAIVSDSVQIGGAVGQVHRNAPSVIIQFMAVMSVMGLFVVTAFVASSIHRDFSLGTHELFFSRPVHKLQYLLGRFIGSLVVSVALFLAPAAGILCGSFMPWLEPERLGPLMAGPYVFSMLMIVVPNVIFMACAFFTLAGITRSMMTTYLGVVITFVIYGVSRMLAQDIESEMVAALADPFGLAPIGLATKYWTIVEQNTMVPAVAGPLLANRLIWIGVGVAILALGCWRFSYSRATSRQRLWSRALAILGRGPLAKGADQDVVEELPGGVVTTAVIELPVAARSFGLAAALRMMLLRARLETRSVLLGIPFIVMLAFGLFNLLASAALADRLAGTLMHPVTHLMLRHLDSSYLFLIIIIVSFYAGELIWKERSLGLHEVNDSLPTPSWVFLGSKLIALSLVAVVFIVAGMVATMGLQLWQGHTALELGLYAKGFLVAEVLFLLIAVLATAVQVLINNKLAGYLVMLVYLISLDVLDALHLEHHLYRYGELPRMPYSDMNGYGHFAHSAFWFALYWSFFALVLIGVSAVMYKRGTESSYRVRLALARQRFRGPAAATIVAGLVLFAVTGSFIFYNTNVLNEYVPGDLSEARQAEYERQFRQYKDALQPRVIDVAADVDIFPDERRVEIKGRYILRNGWDEPIDELYLNINNAVTINRLDLPEHQVRLDDRVLGYSIRDLAEPIAPGETFELGFDLSVINNGFVNGGSMTEVVHNGTFFNNRDFFPLLGYLEERQLVDRNARREHDLPPVRRMALVDDDEARRNSYIAVDSDWVHFETTVSTSVDQIALAPGYLQSEWIEGNRRYFRYEMDAPILHFFAYLSADYTVQKDRWNDVEIAVYYHEPHSYNVDRMIEGVKATLDYCEASFSPYQYRQMRIVEFPRYARVAQAFPNLIPFSESIGFIAKIDDEEDIDYVFDVTAHEVAHQWWAHQMIGANVQGATLMSEALAQYTALMVMEQRYGQEKVGKLLKYELDKYLSGRGGELVEEMPLMLVENQPYIHYRKGSMVMYALQDYFGEETINRALARYLEETAFQGPPYSNSPELLAVLREELPAGSEQMIEDMLETITLYSNRTEEATFSEMDDGRYLVRLTVEAKKLRSDGQGIETEITIDDLIDIGVFGEDDKPLLVEKRRISDQITTFELVVDERPVQAGIDPYHKLIDRVSDDNVKSVKHEPRKIARSSDEPRTEVSASI